MPGIPQKNAQFNNVSISSSGSISTNGIWSKNRGADPTFDQLQKFWSELSPPARQKLLRIDKQTLFEQARKNLYCSRCNGLLLEGFSQIVMYGRSLLQDGSGGHHPGNGKMGTARYQIEDRSDIMSSRCQDVIQDPAVHPWGGLAASRDGMLTLIDCFLCGTSLKPLQNVFDSARARERERELLYPDACGGSGRGWISQGMANYGRGHGIRETCALHTARLSCDTLVDFWSALGDETRQSLLRMKEEDFIERLMYRFDSKRFCRDCRRNVIREFKELKELKRMRRDPRCTNWFCAADTAFQYEVSKDTVLADWHQTFLDSDGTYHHFEWAIGTGEGKSDILEFEDVGMNGSVEVNGLDLGDVNSFFITLRAWKLDGRCTEFTVKAHALKGQPCVHRRLIVGDGFVTITKGESIRRFFEHAEEAEEEEDDDSMDKDGNDLDGDGSRPQKHAKSPELAREFLLDAATVIFKEQVEKAFREGTARQNAHSIFVSLALKLLEERVHVACKEIITLEKQIKLLEEEEKEKREEEERKERRRAKEREKKLRRKERLRGKEGDKDKVATDAKQLPEDGEKDNRLIEAKHRPVESSISLEEASLIAEEDLRSISQSDDSKSATEVTIQPSSTPSSDIVDEQSSNEFTNIKENKLKDDSLQLSCNIDVEMNAMDVNGSFIVEQSKSLRRKLKFRKEPLEQVSWRCERRQSIAENDDRVNGLDIKSDGYKATSTRCTNGLYRHSRNTGVKSTSRNCGSKFGGKVYCSNSRVRDRYDVHSCNCNHIRPVKDFKTATAMECTLDRPFNRNNKYSNGCHVYDTFNIPKGKVVSGNFPSSTDAINTKKVWEPLESRKRCPRSGSDPDITQKSFTCKANSCDGGTYDENQEGDNMLKSVGGEYTSELHVTPSHDGGSNGYHSHADGSKSLGNSLPFKFSINASDPSTSTSSDNCSSCLSEGDSCMGSTGAHNAESQSTSDSEDTCLQSEGRENLTCSESTSCGSKDVTAGNIHLNEQGSQGGETANDFSQMGSLGRCSVGMPTKDAPNSDYTRVANDVLSHRPSVIPMHNRSAHMPVFPAPSTVGYYHQSAAAWASAPTTGMVPYPQHNHYIFSGPIGYGLSVNQTSPFCMQYGGLQSFNSIPNPSQLPSYHQSNSGNISVLNNQIKILKPGPGRTQEATCVAAVERPLAASRTEVSPGKDRRPANPIRTQNENSEFSLFHFGGPIAAANGCSLNQSSQKDGSPEDLSLKSSAVLPEQNGHGCIKKDTTIEEYSLFAASGARFSFF